MKSSKVSEIELKQRVFVSCSEFSQDGYDQADIISAISDYLCDFSLECTRDDADTRRFNEYLLNYKERDKFIAEAEAVKHKIKAFDGLDSLDTSDGHDIDVGMYRDFMLSCLEDIVESQVSEGIIYDKEAADKYLDAFYELAKQVVFSPKNYNLSNPAFRKSQFLEDLLSFAVPETLPSKGHAVSDGCRRYFYSLWDPFAYDTIQRTLSCSDALKQKLSNVYKEQDNNLLNLRYDLFLNSVQSAFRRFIFLGNETYRMDLNRHDSTFLAVPCATLSSIEEIKPIRLFEKTAAYIRNNVVKANSSTYKVKMCVIGHTEKSRNGAESELRDWAAAILNWYSELSIDTESFHKPILHLNILNIINQFDAPMSNFSGERESFSYSRGMDEISCKIEKADYSKEFGFNKKRLKAIIEDSQLIFVLDCPFLTTENLEIKQSGSLDSFCRMLRSKNRNYPPANLNLHSDFQYFYKHSAMQELDSQFNRIMSSTTQNAGEIIRMMKDQLLANIQNMVAEYAHEPAQKNFYIFCSEKDGLDYSYIASYPLTRRERYDGKSFMIVSFSNHKSDMLECNETGSVGFRILLWSVLKYVSVSYAYQFFKEKVGRCFDGVHNRQIDYFAIYRNIVLDCDVDSSLTRIRFQIRLSDGMDDCLKAIDPSVCTEEIKRKLLRLAIELLRPLYQDCVFSGEKLYGNDAIRTAFMMNLYSSANDVNTMLFWHRYRMACENGNFDGFIIEFREHEDIESLAFRDQEFLNKDFLMDKKLYDALMHTLEHTTQFTIGMRAMLYNASAVFEEKKTAQTVLCNIKRACMQAGDVKSRLYQNTCAALNEV